MASLLSTAFSGELRLFHGIAVVEGARYIHIAKALRRALRDDPDHPARNLAELDVAIWLAYADE
jgi:hypothetical protein